MKKNYLNAQTEIVEMGVSNVIMFMSNVMKEVGDGDDGDIMG